MQKIYTIDLQKNTTVQYLVGFLILFIYAGSLFFPLLDKDAAHHANIALRMYEHDDYVSLVDRGKDYLDKPHFLFWTSLLFFELFGVDTFAHRFPALLFTLISIYSIYRLTRHISDKTTARIAALTFATAQGVILGINDARMETPLTAGIALGLWHMIVYVDNRKFWNLLMAALGAAIAFSTKGWLGPVIIFISVFSYILMDKKWSVLLSPKTWLFIPLFFLFISPVLYAYYLQFDLHPEKVIRGENNRSGVAFILWNQLFERYKGFDEGGRNSDYFFLYHTFIWAFFPWSIVAYTALVYWIRSLFFRKQWTTRFGWAALAFAFLLFTISFSKFKMPHYIIMLLPLASIFTGGFIRTVFEGKKFPKVFLPMQIVFGVLVLILTIALNYYAFPPRNAFVWIAGTVIIAAFIYLLFRPEKNKAIRFLYISTGIAIMANFFVNYNFFPSLLKYQGGNEMAARMKKENISIPDSSIITLDYHVHSFDFYRGHNHRIIEPERMDEVYASVKDDYFILTPEIRKYLAQKGYETKPLIQIRDYNIARLSLPFVNPKTRDSKMDSLMLARIIKH